MPISPAIHSGGENLINLPSLLNTDDLAPALAAGESLASADELGRLSGLRVYPRSIAAFGKTLFFLGRKDKDKLLGLLFRDRGKAAEGFDGEERAVTLEGEELSLKLCPLDQANAVALRRVLSFVNPELLGLRRSIGCGDRLGLATPGHVRAVRGTHVAPIFPQQSIREMTRTRRTPQQVMDDAMWGVFQEGWREGFGADADHLKATQDVDICVGAGFVFFTIDPGDYVDNAAQADPPDVLARKVDSLPWAELESSPRQMRRAFLDRSFDLGEGFRFTFAEEDLLRAAAKYGKAVAHTARMYRHLAGRMGDEPFELEVSVDETETPTSVLEHIFVAAELQRLGVKWVSLAPRYVGRFEKGVDYIGDLARFEADFARHVAVARRFGPYKLSLHSGSDKFSIYPIVAGLAGDLVHLKTAGTSYLEALRAIAEVDPGLFREILAFAFQRYGQDKATYHVSADLSKVPAPEQLADSELAGVLESFDGRQLLHVTFGSVLTWQDDLGEYLFRDRLLAALEQNEEAYYSVLETHFKKHLAAFAIDTDGG
jgi:hypothetical protein